MMPLPSEATSPTAVPKRAKTDSKAERMALRMEEMRSERDWRMPVILTCAWGFWLWYLLSGLRRGFGCYGGRCVDWNMLKGGEWDCWMKLRRKWGLKCR